MTLSQSKLMIQLNKQQKISNRLAFNQEQIEEIYTTICKLQPKNLMLVELLSLIIERDFIKNSNKLIYFCELYEEIKGKSFEADHSNSKDSIQAQEQKFSKKKFIKLLKQLTKKLYPGNPNAYETNLFEKLTKIDYQQHRIKIDQSIRKMLTKETVSTINQYDQELQTVFEVYMSENYNLNLQFTWEQIKVLEKRLPIVCCLRFLYQTEVIPHYLSAVQFTEIVSKLKPPILGSSKQAMFYTTQTMTSYLKDHINLPKIKLLDGDIGFTFFEFQIFFIKVATEFSKDSKHEYVNNIRKMATYIKLKEAFDQGAPRRNKFMELIRTFCKNKSGRNEKVLVKKRESRKKIQDLYDSKEAERKEEASKTTFKTISVQPREIQMIMKDLDGELPELPQNKKNQKQNEGYFDVEKKHIVIGEQLPKIQQKAKNLSSKQNKKKNEDSMLGYKSEVPRVVQSSDHIKLIARPKKARVNSQFPIILNQIFYPSDLKNQLFISQKAEVYLQTSYIHLGERLYQQAFMSYVKAKSLTDSKSSLTQFYYNVHAAQIFESGCKDDVALSFYHKAKDLLAMLTLVEGAARAQPYIGMGVCLYHLDYYQLALRCFEKAKAIVGVSLQNESIQSAILQNNIGCCLMMLNRNQKALKYFQTSRNAFDAKVGVFDQRTLVVQQNYNKNRKAYLQLMPEFKTMWKTYIEKSTTKLPTMKQSKPKK